MSIETSPVKVALVNAGVSEASSSTLLAQRITRALERTLEGTGQPSPMFSMIELGILASDIAGVLTGGLSSQALEDAFQKVAQADVIVAITPIYKAGMSGLFKSFIDVMDNDILIGKVVLLGATGGSERHALVLDDHLRPLFAYLRTVTVPTSLYATPGVWSSGEFTRRAERAAVETVAMLGARLQETISAHSWDSYQRNFDSYTTQQALAAQNPRALDFNTPLMRLATGGSTSTETTP